MAANGVSNQISAAANCDQGALWTPRLGWGGRRPTTSASGSSRRWRTPSASRRRCCMLQGEADLRCPPADNEQLFVALRALGRPVEYVLYPEEIAPDAVDRAGPIAASTCSSARERWFRAHGVLAPA